MFHRNERNFENLVENRSKLKIHSKKLNFPWNRVFSCETSPGKSMMFCQIGELSLRNLDSCSFSKTQRDSSSRLSSNNCHSHSGFSRMSRQKAWRTCQRPQGFDSCMHKTLARFRSQSEWPDPYDRQYFWSVVIEHYYHRNWAGFWFQSPIKLLLIYDWIWCGLTQIYQVYILLLSDQIQ